jgi:hypothetical protein
MPRIRASLAPALLLLLAKSDTCAGFLFPNAAKRDDTPRHLTAAAADDDFDDDDDAGSEGVGNGAVLVHRWKHEPFDYSSRLGWDEFYEKNGTQERDADGQSAAIGGVPEYEWHSHIPHSAIVEAVRPSMSAASLHYSRSSGRVTPSILLVGCGNSALPRALHDAFNVGDGAPPVGGARVTCLDYSRVCIDMVKSAYGNSYPNVDFVVGDATDLGKVTWNEGGGGDASSGDDGDDRPSGGCSGTTRRRRRRNFDVVIDKGLLDALMCGDGHDVERLVGGMNDVLVPHCWGLHVLICFPLSASVKRSLEESSPSLDWEFDVPVEGSEGGRATFNLARRCRGQGEDVRIDRISTERIK